MVEKRLHVGLILDGNRRWAKARGLKPWEGHREGAKAFEFLLEALKDKSLPLKTLTMYCFSMQNFNRSDEEKEKLFNIMRKYFKKFRDDPSITENNLRIRFIGRTHLLPLELQEIMGEIENKTKNYSSYFLNFAIAYGGREEIVDAVKSIVSKQIKKDKITEETITSNLYLQDCPDFVIRTSGEKRTSNFLVWQCSYSEWFFLDKHWPDFTKEDLKDCINNFLNNRKRRFGK